MKRIKILKLEEEKLDFILTQFIITHTNENNIYIEEIKLCSKIINQLTK